MAGVVRAQPSRMGGSRSSTLTINRQLEAPSSFNASAGGPLTSSSDVQRPGGGARTPPPSPRRALRSIRSPTPVLSDEAFAMWRRREVVWLRSALDTVTALLPDDVELEPTIHAADALLVFDDEADEALMTTHLDKFSRRLMRKAALSQADDDGDDVSNNRNTVHTAGVEGGGGDAPLSSTITAIDATKASTPEVVEAPHNLFNSKSLTRIFTAVRTFRNRDDVAALQLAARLVDRMLSLRKPRMLRLLLRNFLDDVMVVLRQVYPALSRRRACAILQPDDFPHLPEGIDPFRALSKLTRHLAAIEDLTDALVPPCDDTTYCGLQEFSERLSAMVAVEIARCKLISHACTAIRRAREADPPRETQRMWDVVHECVSRLAAFIACHCEGDDEDSASDSDGGVGNSGGGVPASSAPSKDGDSWRVVLRVAVEESKLLGVVCEALQNSDEGTVCRRRAATTLRCMTQDSETLPLIQESCVRFERVWEYLIPSLVDDDAAVRHEMSDVFAALLGDGRDSCTEHSAALRAALLGPFSGHVLASLDVGTELLLTAADARLTETCNWKSSSPTRLRAAGSGRGPSSPRPTPVGATAVLAVMQTVLLVAPTDAAGALEQAFVAFHREAVLLAVQRVQGAVLLADRSRRCDGAMLAPHWRRHQVPLIELLQYIRSVARVFSGRADNTPRQQLPPFEHVMPLASQHALVQTVLMIMEDTRQRRGASGGCLLLGVCAELLTALKK